MQDIICMAGAWTAVCEKYLAHFEERKIIFICIRYSDYFNLCYITVCYFSVNYVNFKSILQIHKTFIKVTTYLFKNV